MDLKYTKTTLKKMEQLFDEARYQIRYEKGQFHSGYCILEDKKIAVINRFLDIEGKINALLDILPSIKVDFEELSGEMKKFYVQINPNAGDEPNPQLEFKFENKEETGIN